MATLLLYPRQQIFKFPNENFTVPLTQTRIATVCHLASPQTTLKEKMESFWPKKFELPAALKFNPGFREIGEYFNQIPSILTVNLNWLLISSQFDSNILQLLGIQGRIIVPAVTQLFRSKWLHFFFQGNTVAYSSTSGAHFSKHFHSLEDGKEDHQPHNNVGNIDTQHWQSDVCNAHGLLQHLVPETLLKRQ